MRPAKFEPRRDQSRANVDAIVDAAEQLIDEDGWENLAIRDVAVRANVHPSTLYRYFTDRASIAAALVARDGATYAWRLRAAGLAPDVVAHMLNRDPAAVISLTVALDKCNREAAWHAPIGYLPTGGAR